VGLNEPQRAAISFALACNEVALLHGPPGTGKTTTVVELILQAVRRGARVLACAPSNIAVDNMVERLAQYPKTRILRLGHPARLLPSVLSRSLDVLVQQAEGTKLVNDVKKEIKDATQKLSKAKSGGERRELIGELKLLRKEIRKREKDTLKALVKDSQVVLATITGCDDKLLKDDNSFDLVRYAPTVAIFFLD
jgi:DNA polymerase alpha-associated DNA helicase A